MAAKGQKVGAERFRATSRRSLCLTSKEVGSKATKHDDEWTLRQHSDRFRRNISVAVGQFAFCKRGPRRGEDFGSRLARRHVVVMLFICRVI